MDPREDGGRLVLQIGCPVLAPLGREGAWSGKAQAQPSVYQANRAANGPASRHLSNLPGITPDCAHRRWTKERPQRESAKRSIPPPPPRRGCPWNCADPCAFLASEQPLPAQPSSIPSQVLRQRAHQNSTTNTAIFSKFRNSCNGRHNCSTWNNFAKASRRKGGRRPRLLGRQVLQFS